MLARDLSLSYPWDHANISKSLDRREMISYLVPDVSRYFPNLSFFSGGSGFWTTFSSSSPGPIAPQLVRLDRSRHWPSSTCGIVFSDYPWDSLRNNFLRELGFPRLLSNSHFSWELHLLVLYWSDGTELFQCRSPYYHIERWFARDYHPLCVNDLHSQMLS